MTYILRSSCLSPASRRPLLSLDFSTQSLLHWKDGRELDSPASPPPALINVQLRLCTVATSPPRPSKLDHFPQSQRRPPLTPRPAQDPAKDHKRRWDSVEAVHFQGDHTETGGRQLHLVRSLQVPGTRLHVSGRILSQVTIIRLPGESTFSCQNDSFSETS